MARNFFEAGLKYLVTEHWRLFDKEEQAVLSWLYKASQHSEELYFEELYSAPIGSDLSNVIERIKFKCRINKMHDAFHRMRDDFQSKV